MVLMPEPNEKYKQSVLVQTHPNAIGTHFLVTDWRQRELPLLYQVLTVTWTLF